MGERKGVRVISAQCSCFSRRDGACLQLHDRDQVTSPMPLLEINIEQKEHGLAMLETDFKFMLSERAIPTEVQAVLGHVGITSVQLFADLETTKEELRKTLASAVGVNGEEDFQAKLTMSRLLGLWGAAHKRVEARDSEEANARAEGRTRVLPVSTFTQMPRSFESVHGKFDDREYPCRTWTQHRIEQLEDNDYRAESLTEVVSAHSAGEENAETGILFNPSGR